VVICVVTEQRYIAARTGEIELAGALNRDFWEAYGGAGGPVRIVARVDSGALPPGVRIDELPTASPQVTCYAVPYYEGVTGLLKAGPAALRRLMRLSGTPATFVIRMPSAIGSMLAILLICRRRRYAVEVIGDAEAAAVHSGRLPLSTVSSILARWLQRVIVRSASVVSHVSGVLAERYPPAQGTPTLRYSSIRLHESDFAATPLSTERANGKRILFVGSLEAKYKGLGTLLEAVPTIAAAHRDLQVTVVGDGRLRPVYEARCSELALPVKFVGAVPTPQAVQQHMDAATVLVLPSFTEGMPRVLIEALARGLPAIASRVGGTAELLPEDALFDAGDADALSERVISLLASPARLEERSRAGLEVARRFSVTSQSAAREMFLSEATAAGR
jgi:phosphatidyl-myo-inositol dimannoside synthase